MQPLKQNGKPAMRCARAIRRITGGSAVEPPFHKNATLADSGAVSSLHQTRNDTIEYFCVINDFRRPPASGRCDRQYDRWQQVLHHSSLPVEIVEKCSSHIGTLLCAETVADTALCGRLQRAGPEIVGRQRGIHIVVKAEMQVVDPVVSHV
jgi:hypothetical protein